MVYLNYGDMVVVFKNQIDKVSHKLDWRDNTTIGECMEYFVENINLHNDI